MPVLSQRAYGIHSFIQVLKSAKKAFSSKSYNKFVKITNTRCLLTVSVFTLLSSAVLLIGLFCHWSNIYFNLGEF